MRVIGIARQSKGDEASFSIEAQRDKIETWCKANGHTLVRVYEERDVSGGTPFDKRPGLRPAVEAIEAGEAEALVAAYRTRLARSNEVRLEIVRRVEAVGGEVHAVDTGAQSIKTATTKLSGNLLGSIDEHTRDVAREYAADTHSALVAEGRSCGGKPPFGYEVDSDGRLAPVPAQAALVVDAYRMRAQGDSLESIRAHLGVRYASVVSRVLANRAYLGELRHGQYVNTSAHEPIIDGPLFRKVQATHTPRGKRPASDRLLARLEILRCATCSSRMVVHGSKESQVYRCGGQDCSRKFSISCHLADEAVTHAVRLALSGREGRAGANLPALQAERDSRAALLDAAIDSFSALQNRDRAKAKLAELEAGVEAAEDSLAEAREAAGVVVAGGLAWEEMGIDLRRAMIRAAVAEAVVGPGVGGGRVRVSLSEAFAPEPALDRMADEAAIIMADIPPRAFGRSA